MQSPSGTGSAGVSTRTRPPSCASAPSGSSPSGSSSTSPASTTSSTGAGSPGSASGPVPASASSSSGDSSSGRATTAAVTSARSGSGPGCAGRRIEDLADRCGGHRDAALLEQFTQCRVPAGLGRLQLEGSDGPGTTREQHADDDGHDEDAQGHPHAGPAATSHAHDAPTRSSSAPGSPASLSGSSGVLVAGCATRALVGRRAPRRPRRGAVRHRHGPTGSCAYQASSKRSEARSNGAEAPGVVRSRSARSSPVVRPATSGTCPRSTRVRTSWR